ncbi:MAG: 2-phospho-L-lactate transferase [Pseudomonadota bacterium]
MSAAQIKVTLIAGGVGGAKMAEGFAALEQVDLTVIGNIADDEAFYGLWVSPDIDTLTYSLAGLINRAQGWGVADEGLRALDVLKTLGQDTWMTLGDRDLGLHIYRTMRRAAGDRPSMIARDISARFGVTAQIVLPSDDIVQTRVKTDAGWISFQEYFVRERCRPEVQALRFEGIENARPTQEALAAISGADMLVIAPSNPLVSIAPILNITGIRDALRAAAAPVLGVSPLIGGKVVKGPADRMMKALGLRCDAVGVASLYADLLDLILIDTVDAGLSDEILALDVGVGSTDIMMRNLADKARLAGEILAQGIAMKKARAA